MTFARGIASLKFHLYAKDGIPVDRVKFRAYPEVLNAVSGKGIEIHIAPQASQEVDVVCVVVRRQSPFGNPHRDEICCSKTQQGGDVKLKRGEAALVVPNLLPIHPDLRAVIRTLEPQADAAALPPGGNGKGSAVVAHFVVRLRPRGLPETLRLPIAGHLN